MQVYKIHALRRSQVLGRDAIVCCFMVLMAFGIGITINAFREKPLPLIYQTKAERLDQTVASLVQDTAASPNSANDRPSIELSMEEFQTFVDQKKGLILDTRPGIFHRLGHVPGALSLPRETFESSYSKLKETLEKDKGQPLVLYCSSPSCEDSRLVHSALLKLGYSNVRIFPDGWEAWTRAGLKEQIQP